jgi:hypothetical protein
MAVSVKLTYPEPQPQPQPIGAAMGQLITINLATNEVSFVVQETLLVPDGSTRQSAKKAVKVLLADATLKTFISNLLTEAQAQGALAEGSVMTATVG